MYVMLFCGELRICCDFVYRQANLCCELRSNLSPQFIKKNLQFSAEVGLEPGLSDPETYTLPLSYQADDEEICFA